MTLLVQWNDIMTAHLRLRLLSKPSTGSSALNLILLQAHRKVLLMPETAKSGSKISPLLALPWFGPPFLCYITANTSGLECWWGVVARGVLRCSFERGIIYCSRDTLLQWVLDVSIFRILDILLQVVALMTGIAPLITKIARSRFKNPIHFKYFCFDRSTLRQNLVLLLIYIVFFRVISQTIVRLILHLKVLLEHSCLLVTRLHGSRYIPETRESRHLCRGPHRERNIIACLGARLHNLSNIHIIFWHLLRINILFLQRHRHLLLAFYLVQNSRIHNLPLILSLEPSFVFNLTALPFNILGLFPPLTLLLKPVIFTLAALGDSEFHESDRIDLASSWWLLFSRFLIYLNLEERGLHFIKLNLKIQYTFIFK